MTFKDEIKDLLRDEIVGRYYYQAGRIQSTIRDDAQLDKAIEILKEPGAVSSVLHGTYDTGEIKLAMDLKK